MPPSRKAVAGTPDHDGHVGAVGRAGRRTASPRYGKV